MTTETKAHTWTQTAAGEYSSNCGRYRIRHLRNPGRTYAFRWHLYDDKENLEKIFKTLKATMNSLNAVSS